MDKGRKGSTWTLGAVGLTVVVGGVLGMNADEGVDSPIDELEVTEEFKTTTIAALNAYDYRCPAVNSVHVLQPNERGHRVRVLCEAGLSYILTRTHSGNVLVEHEPYF